MNLSREATHFLTEWGVSLKKVEAAEAVYRGVVAAYNDRYGPGVTADFRASSDADLRTAQGDCGYYQGRATMYGISALVQLRLDEDASALLFSRLVALHRPAGEGLHCLEDALPWPCNTRRVINGEVPFALDVAGWSA